MIARMLGAARLNAETYEDVENDRGATIQALLVVIIVTIASVIGDVLRVQMAGRDIEWVSSLIIGIVLGIVIWALWALVTWMVGVTILNTEKTEADWGQLARGTGFAQTPRILNVFLFIPVAGPIIALLGLVWTFACMVVAVRQCLDYTSTLRAFFVILIAAIPMFFLLIILGTVVLIIAGGNGGT